MHIKNLMEHRKWGEDDLEYLVENDPDRLLQLLRDNDIYDVDLSFAAEKAGMIQTKEAVETLISLLNHNSSLVREGAIYGLVNAKDVWTEDYGLWIRVMRALDPAAASYPIPQSLLAKEEGADCDMPTVADVDILSGSD